MIFLCVSVFFYMGGGSCPSGLLSLEPAQVQAKMANAITARCPDFSDWPCIFMEALPVCQDITIGLNAVLQATRMKEAPRFRDTFTLVHGANVLVERSHTQSLHAGW